MRIKLGVITPDVHIPFIKKVETHLKDLCTFKYLSVQGLEDVRKTYLENFNSVDGFVFRGTPFYWCINDEDKDPLKPCYVIADDKENLYKQLLMLSVNNSEIDFSRIYIDFACEINNYMGLNEIFPEDKRPYYFPWNSKNPNEVKKSLLNNHIRLWEEDKIDLSITRYGLVLQELNKRGVKNMVVHPSENYYLQIFSKAINEILNIKNDSIKPVVAHIFLDNKNLNEMNYDAELKFLALHKEIIEYSLEYDYDFVIQERDNFIEIYTTYENFTCITDNLKTCLLMTYLQERLDSRVKIGWGSGNSIQQANLNALNADKQCYQYDGSCSFFVGEDQNVIGPLGEAKQLKYSQNADQDIIELSNELGINNIHLQKIISFCKKSGTNKLSSEDVAQCLVMTTKGANRILNKIENKNMTKIVFEKRENSKGRPKKYYELRFLDKNGDEDWTETMLDI